MGTNCYKHRERHSINKSINEFEQVHSSRNPAIEIFDDAIDDNKKKIISEIYMLENYYGLSVFMAD